MGYWKLALRIGIVSASLIVASGIAIGTIEVPGVNALAILLARLAAFAFGVMGVPATLDGAVIDAGDFVAVIAVQCTAIELILVYSAAVLVTPVHLTARIWALVLGMLALCVLNLVRVVSLLLVGVSFPDHFDTAHLFVWQVGMAAAALAMWLVWYGRATGSSRIQTS